MFLCQFWPPVLVFVWCGVWCYWARSCLVKAGQVVVYFVGLAPRFEVWSVLCVLFVRVRNRLFFFLSFAAAVFTPPLSACTRHCFYMSRRVDGFVERKLAYCLLFVFSPLNVASGLSLQVVEADVIVHIVDVSSPSREKQESAVTGVLGEMGVLNKPRLTLWNKLDLLPEEEQVRLDLSCRFFS